MLRRQVIEGSCERERSVEVVRVFDRPLVLRLLYVGLAAVLDLLSWISVGRVRSRYWIW